MSDFGPLVVLLSLTALLVAALHDLAVRTVPNWLLAALAGSAILSAVVQHRLLASLLVAGVLLVTSILLWCRGFLGGADAKMLPASSLLIGPGSIILMLLTIAVAGGALCLPYILGRYVVPRPKSGRPTRLLPRILRCELWRLRRGGPLPYAVAIAAGTIFAMHGG
jgi:prepilin peptidase CpaA